MSNEQKPIITDGILISPKVIEKRCAGIEKGKLMSVDAIVVHQTGAATADSSFHSYKDGKNGAHFLVDLDGSIYQTARVDQICWHVGTIHSRCYRAKKCTVDDLKAIKGIMFNQGDKYWASKINKHEIAKSYPDRFPLNQESLGIEIVGAFVEGKGFDPVRDEQNTALAWLVATLNDIFGLDGEDVFRHGEIGMKQPDEAATARW